MPVFVVRGLKGMTVFTGRAKVQVVGLALGVVMVEHGSRERRYQRYDRRKRDERADASDNHFESHRSAEIIA